MHLVLATNKGNLSRSEYMVLHRVSAGLWNDINAASGNSGKGVDAYLRPGIPVVSQVPVQEWLHTQSE
eukprot:3513986-Amphidinium_carterae.1